MAKRVTVLKENVSQVKPNTDMKPQTGELRKNLNEDNEADMIGTLHIDMPGAYWLNGFMKKDTQGVFMDLQASLQNEQPEAKLLRDRGVLFVNNRKNRKGKPDYTGNIEVTTPGIYSIEGLVKESKGTKFMELNILDGTDNGIATEDMPF